MSKKVYEFEKMGIVNVEPRTGSSITELEQLKINNVVYLKDRGKFTSSGVESWFTPITNFEVINGVIDLKSGRPGGILKLKNNQINYI